MRGGDMGIADWMAGYTIVSDEAVVVSSRAPCWKCGASIDVICLYCQTGLVHGEPMMSFSVSSITAMDDALRVQLLRWPDFHQASRGPGAGSLYLNHCPACGISQDDFFLHCRPHGAFFRFDDRSAAGFKVTALAGLVRMSGDEGFEP